MGNDVAIRLRTVLDGLAPGYGLRAAWLFGSEAKGTATARSDVDVAVMLEKALDIDRRIDMTDAISASLGRQVDLVDIERSSPILMHQVLRDGLLLLDLDRFRRLMYECTVPSRYRDLKRFRRGSELALREALQRG
jgi:predicted nucleotidyltransferase